MLLRIENTERNITRFYIPDSTEGPNHMLLYPSWKRSDSGSYSELKILRGTLLNMRILLYCTLLRIENCSRPKYFTQDWTRQTLRNQIVTVETINNYHLLWRAIVDPLLDVAISFRYCIICFLVVESSGKSLVGQSMTNKCGYHPFFHALLR
jgi:hypothetical protein